jgi:hypothetical protein
MNSNIILYTTDTNSVSVQVQYEDGTFWLTQKRMSELFGVDVRTVNEHLANIYASRELNKTSTIRKIRIVQLAQFWTQSNTRILVQSKESILTRTCSTRR